MLIRLDGSKETEMRVSFLQVSLFLVAFGLYFMPGEGFAQPPCPEGRTAGGECVNPAQAATNRTDSIIFSQSQLSRTAHPISPELDYRYRYPHELTGDAVSPQTAANPTFAPALVIPDIPTGGN
jgi:hypothetical protein